MADFGEEVLLGEPEVAEPGVLRRDHVVEVLPIHVAFGVLGPWLRHLKLAQQAEFHRRSKPYSAAAIAGRTRAIRSTSIDASRHASPLAMNASR